MEQERIKKFNLLFVCTGNTCRSAMAEQIFADFMAKKGCAARFKITSAGICAKKGEIINPQAVNALIKLGIKPKKYRSKPLTHIKLKRADLVVCMTISHKDWLFNNFGHFKNVYAFGAITGAHDVPDPFGMSEIKYLSCAKYLSYACEDILNLINKIVRENDSDCV